MTPGCFVVIEGVEGAGKSTQVARLASWLEERGVSHLVTREPGGTPLGEAVRSVVLDRPDLDVPPAGELFLILAARAAFVRDVVRPALQAGRVVVADRYDHSTLAYQAFGRGLPLDEVRRANNLATGGLRPDLALVLDVPVEEGLARQASQGKEADRMEREGPVFLQRVREGYLRVVESDDRAVLLEATGSVDSVFQKLLEALQAALPETFAEPAAWTESSLADSGRDDAGRRGRTTPE